MNAIMSVLLKPLAFWVMLTSDSHGGGMSWAQFWKARRSK